MDNTFNTEITSKGIEKVLKKYTPERAIGEYIWNGFDANASSVNVQIGNNDFDIISTIIVKDDGTGIDYEKLNIKFKNFLESAKGRKSDDGHRIKGKNGYGRLTFFKLSSDVLWRTIYKNGNENQQYEIKISKENLKQFTASKREKSSKSTGTEVVFSNIHITETSESFTKSLEKYLKQEFSWFLALDQSKKLYINEEELDYLSFIGEQESWNITIEEKTFVANYFRWNEKLNDEYSMFYFLNSKEELIHQETTKFNKKGDNFWHTVIIKDSFYDDIYLEDVENPTLFTDGTKLGIQKKLSTELNIKLKEKRKPFLHDKAVQWVMKTDEEGFFPIFSNNPWDNARKKTLENLVTEFYEVEPQIFISLSQKQKTVLLNLLNLIMDSDARNDLFKILESVVELEDEDRSKFAHLLERTKLQHIIDLSNLVKDRLDTIENLRQLVFNHELKATERLQLQKFIEQHYWIFGEQYRMVCAEEVKFENALQRYKYILFGVDEKEYINNINKYKEMDLFLAGSEFIHDKRHNLVVEIKNPTTIKKLTDRELSQIKTYANTIKSTDAFNSNSEHWTFILVGQDYDENVDMAIPNNNKVTGLAVDQQNYQIFIKKWSDVIADAEARMRYLDEKLKLQKLQFSKDTNLPDVMNSFDNTAVMLAEDIIGVTK